jgi:hypothetical protein
VAACIGYALSDEPTILDYASPTKRVRPSPSVVPVAKPELPIAYPPDEPRPLIPLFLSFFVVPIVLTAALLAVFYFAFVPQH